MAQVEETPAAEDIDPFEVAGVERTVQPGTLASPDVSKLVTQQQGILKDLETQRALTALNTEERKDILARSEAAAAPVREEAIGAMRSREAAAEQVASQPIPSIPAPPKVQDFMNRDTATIMASIGALIAGFNSNGRIRGVRANLALAGALTGFQQGSLLRAKLGLEDWRNEVEAQLAEFKMIRQRNLDILSAKGMTVEDKLQEIQLVQAPYMNEMMRATIEKQGIEGVLKIDKEMAGIIDATEKTLLRGTGALNRLTGAQYKNLWALRSEGQKTGNPEIDRMSPETARGLLGKAGAGPGGNLALAGQAAPGQKNEAYLASLPPGEQQMVKAMAEYDFPISGFGGLDVNTRSRLVQEAKLYDPTFDAKQYPTRVKVMGDFSPAGPSGRNIVTLNTLTYHLESFKKAYEQLDNRQIQLWNTASNKLATNFGDPALKAVQVPAVAIADDMARILKGGTAAPTDQEMAVWQSVYSTSMSPKQMEATVWQSLDVAGGRLFQMAQAYQQAMDKPLPNGGIYPDTRRIITENKPANVATPSWLRQAPAPQAGGQVIPGSIVVRRKSDGQPGLIKESDFNPALYEKIPAGVPVQAGTHPMQAGEAEY